LTSAKARRSSPVAATETAAVEVEYEDEETLAEFEGDEALATSRGLSCGETPCVDVAMRRATGLGCAVRSFGFGSSLPFATGETARPKEATRKIA
jgi:hypothetical protein